MDSTRTSNVETTGTPKQRGRLPSLSLKQREIVTGYAFLVPFMFFFLVFLAGPVLAAISYAFLDWELLRGTREFVGFMNFRLMFEDDLFWLSMKNAIIFALMTAAGNTVVALGAALAIKSIKVGHTLYRVAFYAPVVLSVSVIGIIFQRLLSLNGVLNYGLSLLGINEINYLGDPNLVLTSLSLTTIWWGFGFPMLIFLAAIYSVPESLYEAARLDGANSWSIFSRITFPLIRPALLFVTVTQFIGHIQVFGQSYIITEGGPGYASYTIILHIYRNAWRYYHVGYAGAMALALAFVMLVFTLIQFRLIGQSVEY